MTERIKSKQNYVFENVSKTQHCLVNAYFEPSSIDEIKQILKKAQSNSVKVRVVGRAHSFSPIVCTDGYLINLCNLNQLIEIDYHEKLVTVQSGMTLTDLNQILAQKKLALPILGAMSDFSIGGVISTGTHGSSIKVGTMSSLVENISMVTANGEIIKCSRQENADIFLAAVCSMGSCGVITEITLKCVDACNLKLVSYGENIETSLLKIDAQLKKHDYFEIFWYPHTSGSMVWEINQTTEKRNSFWFNWFWNTLIGVYLLLFLYWIGTFYPSIIPWVNKQYYNHIFSKKSESVNRSDMVLNYHCNLDQFNTEWSIPISEAVTAYTRIKQWLTKSRYKAQFPVEFRFVKGDNLYLSHAYGENRCYINILCNKTFGRIYPHDDYWREFENIMFSLGGRPHWAKDHTRTARDLEKVYPKWKEFQIIRKRLDPNGIFMNEYLQQILGS